MQKVAQAYFNTHISTTDQGRLLLMLYDGALKFLSQAREKILERDVAGKGILISKAIDIVNELAGSLNVEKGGTLAQNLNNLYFLCTARLLKANAKLDIEALDSVVAVLTGLRGAYAQIVDTPEAKAAVEQISARQNPQDALMTARAPITQNTPAPSAGVGRLQAQAAYGALSVVSRPETVAAPVGSMSEQKQNETVVTPQQAVPADTPVSVEASAPMPVPPPQTGLGRGLAAYGKLTVRTP